MRARYILDNGFFSDGRENINSCVEVSVPPKLIVPCQILQILRFYRFSKEDQV